VTTFVSKFNQLDVNGQLAQAANASVVDVETALSRCGTSRFRLEDFAALISPVAGRRPFLEEMAQRAHELTIKYFGKVVRLFAPLYVSNECINLCQYCGFSRDNPILRVTLTLEQVHAEAAFLRQQGFRHILLVAGEHPHFVSKTYLRDCVALLRSEWPSIALEVGPMETVDYEEWVRAGAEGLVVYQETYDRTVYAAMHTGGPKKDFDWRMETPERAYAAGFKRLGIGALLGLAPWRHEAVAVVAHAEHLLRQCWRSQVTVSIPRLRPAAGEFQSQERITDGELVQLVCALRLSLPQVGIVLSTREPARMRDGLVPLGVTLMSAGSHTEPGGYTRQGREALHLTKGGHVVKPPPPVIASEGEYATMQFEIGDNRPPEEIAKRLATLGYEPVWKDWEMALNET
jgi:2-iminoacetate synthase